MLFILTSIVILMIIFWGIGQLSNSMIGAHFYINPFLNIFLGIFTVSLFAMAASLFWPLGNSSFFLMICFSIPGLFLSIYKKKPLKVSRPFLFFFFISLVLISLIMGYEVYPYNSDTDFYHANAVKWLREYGTVIGLNNLNQRFGINTSWHTLAAVLDHSIWSDRTTWILPSLAYVSTLGYFLWEIFHTTSLWKKTFGLIIIAWTFSNVLTWGFPCLHYDFIPLVYNALLVFETLDYSLSKRKKEALIPHFLVLFLLATASFLIKPMGAMSIIFIVIFIFYMLYQEKKLNIKNIFLICFIPAFSFGVWLTRNIILSGWPLYPSPHFALNFDWTTPFNITNRTYVDVLYWARRPLPDYMAVANQSFLFWFIPWIKINFVSIRFWIVGILPFIAGLLAWFSLRKSLKNKRTLFFLTWSASSLIFWFIIAPDIRFGDGLFIVFCATGLTFFIEKYNFKVEPFLTEKKIIYAVVTFFFLFFLAIILVLYTGKRGPVNVFKIGKHESGPIQLIPIKENGKTVLEVWSPIEISRCNNSPYPHICPLSGNLHKDFATCSNSPLPCTGYFDDKLRLRVDGHIEKGFKLLR